MPDKTPHPPVLVRLEALRGTRHMYSQQQRATAYAVALHLARYFGPQRFVLTIPPEPDDE